MSATLYLSALFALFSPLPILLLAIRSPRVWAPALAILTNSFWVFLAGGSEVLAVYLVFAVVPALGLALFLRNRWTVERATGATLLVMAASGLAVEAYVAHRNKVSIQEVVLSQAHGLVTTVEGSLSAEAKKNLVGENGGADELTEWRKAFIAELPSAIALFGIAILFANLVTVLRVNPGQIREKLGLDAGFFRSWKAPEILLWPTILAGAGIVFEMGPEWATVVSLNAFKVLMAVYAIQGLSILSTLFDLWKIRGWMRTLGFLTVVFLMMPLLLGLGFFDQWFDFRSKLRQT